MILIKLKGGLGNQMFQYAVGKSLAQANRTQLVFDTVFYQNPVSWVTHRNLDITCFNTHISEATQSHKNWFFKRSFRQKVLKNLLRQNFFYIEEASAHFNPDIPNLRGNVFLDGYFVSFKYLTNIESELLKDFTLKNIEKVTEKLSEINGESVAIHIRLGDYLANPEYRPIFDVCTTEYYQRAIALVQQKHPNARFYLFSDEPEKALSYLYGIDLQVFNGHLFSPAENLWAMSRCKHQIIANSTFSWWAAWLNPNPTKIVVAPNKWFNTLPHDINDIIPKNWIKL